MSNEPESVTLVINPSGLALHDSLEIDGTLYGTLTHHLFFTITDRFLQQGICVVYSICAGS